MRIKATDDYIAKAADFAKPILHHFRELVHQACPDVEEKIKWGMPFFDYKGGPMCHMAAFKQHCAIGFWKAALMKDPSLLEFANSEAAMGHLGKITSPADLPADKKLTAYIKEAMQLNEAGIKLPPKPKSTIKKELEIPEALTQALRKNKKAQQTFEGFSYSHKKEYVTWITEAKTDATRDKRITSAIELMAEGKTRLWKYGEKKGETG